MPQAKVSSSFVKSAARGRNLRLRRRAVSGLLAAPLALLLTVTASAGTLTPIPVKTPANPAHLFNPAADGPWLAWQQFPDRLHTFTNYFVQRGSEPPRRVNARGTVATGGGIDGRTLVYSQVRDVRGADPDLFRFDLRTGRRTALPAMVNSPNAEMDPDLSGRFLLFTRSRLVGEGREEAEITEVLLYNRNTRTLRLLSRARNRFFFVGTQHHSLAAGQINGAYAVWTRYTHGLDSIERSAVVLHNIQTGTTTTLPQPRRTYQDGPGVATDGTVYYTRLIKTRTGGGIGPVGWVLEQPIGAPAEVVFTFDALTEGAGGFYVDERANERHIYFGFRHGRGGFSDIYKVVEPTP